ncbi:hypothetical protein AX16_005712 [Volvariella volvacea WC 439]|nr:hypothetical protein AX16_005712 [Volvariella volvacea WC 439]
MSTTSNHLPAYPSKHVLEKLAPSQLTTLTNSIYTRLTQTIALPPQQRDAESISRFVHTYVKDAAIKELEDTIWGDSGGAGNSAIERLKKLGKVERAIRREVLKLVDVVVHDALNPANGSSRAKGEKALQDLLDLQTLLDLCIVYASTHPKRLRSILKTVFDSKTLSDTLTNSLKSDLIPAFTLLLASSYSSSSSTSSDTQPQPQPRTQPGLYALRKTSYCIVSLLRVLPTPPLHQIFCDSTSPNADDAGRKFLLSIASAYQTGLETIARNYGGVRGLERIVNENATQSSAEDWEKLWVETKVAFVDSFHIIFKVMLDDLTDAGRTAAGNGGAGARRLAGALENVFGLIYALLEIPNDNATQSQREMPFLNRSLLADYQHAYDLSQTLSSSLSGSGERDPRLDHLEAVLQTFEGSLAGGDSSTGTGKGKDAGVLKILLKSSGIPLGAGVDALGKGSSKGTTAIAQPSQAASGAPHPDSIASNTQDKGKGKAPAKPVDPILESKVDQVLEILPDFSRDYVRALLEIGDESYPFKGDPERVIAALLEGTAPGEEELERLASLGGPTSGDYGGGYVSEQAPQALPEDELVYARERRNAFDDLEMDLSQLHIGKKSGEDVLRDRSFIEQMKADILRRAEEISDDEDEENENSQAAGDDLPDDDVGALTTPRVKIAGDGEDSEKDRSDGEGEGDDAKPPSVETILELAYLKDPSLFDRDAQTRRSKARTDLKAQTGWGDEQIEGWRIMLERNPRKDKILAKHEFRGNQNTIPAPAEPGPSRGGRGGHGGRGRGNRGGGRGRGRGGGQGGASGEGGGGDARDRAWKDRNKASRANHHRKRGHDKKMARMGGPSA